MNKVDVRKAKGLDRVPWWILNECCEQLAEKLHSIMSTFLSEWETLYDFKRGRQVRGTIEIETNITH